MTRSRQRFGLRLVLALVAMPGIASASPWSIASVRTAPDSGGLRRGAPPVDDAADASRREAAAAFADAEAAFDRGEYVLAADRFARADALSPHPWTLYNLALSRARAGQPREAWAAFDELGRRAPNEAERREAMAERDALRPLLAFVRLVGVAGGRACIDGVAIELDARGEARRVLDPGTHRITTARSDHGIDLAAGRELEVDARPLPPKRSRARPALVVATVMSGAAMGASIGGAAVTGSRAGQALAGTAASVSAVALAASIAALVIERREQRSALPPTLDCGGS